MSNTDEYLNMLKKGIKNIEEELDSMNSIIEKLEQPDDPRLVKDIDVNWIGTKLFEVTWTPVHENAKIDIQFYDADEEDEWLHSVLKYHPSGSISASNGSHKVGLGGSDTDKHEWNVRIVEDGGDWKSDPVTLKPRESDSGGGDGEGDDNDDSSDVKDNQFPIYDDQYGRIRGVIDWKGGTRVYAYIAEGSGDNAKGIYAFDSDDLKTWKRSAKPEFPEKMWIFQDPENGKIYGYTQVKDPLSDEKQESQTYLWDDFNPDKGCQRRLNKMYQWRLDGTLAPTKTKNGFIQLGRVRGYGSEDEGRWNYNNIPPYPRLKDHPVMQQVWEDKGNTKQGERWVKDRRGVSLHLSEDGENWDSKILLDPMEVDLDGFRGWTQKDKDGIADFYSAVAIDDKRVFLKVYWKEKDRFIDRFDYVDEDKQDDYDIRRRFRFTGETTFIPAVLEDGKLRITSTKSVIPTELHDRIVTKEQVHWATNPGVPEVGQLTPHGRVIYRDGYAHIFYYYRDDIHYEGGWDKQDEGIFVYRMPEDEFDALFE